MSNRIIDLTLKTTLTGTESIPGTEQTSTGDTIPANVRWTWNGAVKTWIKTWIKEWIEPLMQADGLLFTKTEYTFTEADYWTFEPDQYELVIFVNARFTTATTIKIGTLTEPEAYIAETSNTSSNIGLYCDSSNVSDRRINIALNGSGTVTIISIKNV